MQPNIPQVVLLGRTNVGKSTLFNRLVGDKKALVSPIPGTTRDRKIGKVFWAGRMFELVDTGGPDVLEASLAPQIQKQIHTAIKNAKIIIFVVDGASELLPQDKKVVQELRHAKKQVILGINKIDNQKKEKEISPEILGLGFSHHQIFSAINGSGTGDLLDLVLSLIPRSKRTEAKEADPIKVALIGRPNVGKSSLLNAIFGQERVIVSPLPHTTRDIHDVDFAYRDRLLRIIDTVGIRRKSKVWGIIENEGIRQTIDTLRRADIIVMMIEADKTISNQDKELIRLIREKRKKFLLVLNKWDLVKNKKTQTTQYYLHYFHSVLPFLKDIEFILISAMERKNIKKVLDTIIELYDAPRWTR